MNGSAKNAPRESRNGPRPELADRSASVPHAIASAAHEPVGSSEIETIATIVRMNLNRASSRWRALSRSM
jgi:predicted neutral ceramidase superfamily lipid hydrolase